MNITHSSLRPCTLHFRALEGLNAQRTHHCAQAAALTKAQRGARGCTAIRAGLQNGWDDAHNGSSEPGSLQYVSRAAATTPSRRVQMLAALLALGGLSCFAYTGSVSAADLQDNLPLFHPAAADINQLAESEDFWSNILRYVSYFFSVLLGTAYTAIKPIGGFLRKPVSAVITIVVIVGLYVFVSSTVNAMLGVNQQDVLLLPPLTSSSG